MLDSRSIVGQLHDWLSEDAPDQEVHALIDLPDTGWVRVTAFTPVGDLFKLTYRPLVAPAEPCPDVELVCPVSAVIAVRRCACGSPFGIADYLREFFRPDTSQPAP